MSEKNQRDQIRITITRIVFCFEKIKTIFKELKAKLEKLVREQETIKMVQQILKKSQTEILELKMPVNKIRKQQTGSAADQIQLGKTKT